MARIQFTSVTKLYGRTAALHAFSFDFPEKQISVIIGRSGSGKSTILQLTMGLTLPTSGAITAFGAPIDYAHLVRYRRRFGYAVQGTGLFPHLTVFENIALPAKLAQWPPAEAAARVDTLLHMVELPDELRDRYPFELSGGQQQRVGLCRAMMLDPAVFLFDEPFGALDPITRSEIHNEFLRIQQLAPRTIIMVTHDMHEAIKLADQILVLERGELVQAGTAAAILEHPATPFVEELIHSQLEV